MLGKEIYKTKVNNKILDVSCDPRILQELNLDDIKKTINASAIPAIKKMLQYFPELEQKTIQVVILNKDSKNAPLSISADEERYYIFTRMDSISEIRQEQFAHELMHHVAEIRNKSNEILAGISRHEEKHYKEFIQMFKRIQSNIAPHLKNIIETERSHARQILNLFDDILINRNLAIIGLPWDVEKTEGYIKVYLKNLKDFETYEKLTLSTTFFIYTDFCFIPFGTRCYNLKSKNYARIKKYEEEWIKLVNNLEHYLKNEDFPLNTKQSLKHDILHFYKEFVDIVQNGTSIQERPIAKDVVFPLHSFSPSGMAKIQNLIRWWYNKLIELYNQDKECLTKPIHDILTDIQVMIQSTFELYNDFINTVGENAKNSDFVKAKYNGLGAIEKVIMQGFNSQVEAFRKGEGLDNNALLHLVQYFIRIDDIMGKIMDDFKNNDEGDALDIALERYKEPLIIYEKYVAKLKEVANHLETGKMSFIQIKKELDLLKKLAD